MQYCIYIPGIYLSDLSDSDSMYLVYTRYIPGKSHFYRFQMAAWASAGRGGGSVTAGRSTSNKPARARPTGAVGARAYLLRPGLGIMIMPLRLSQTP